MRQDRRLARTDPARLELANRWGIPVRVLADERIPLERNAVDELENVLATQATVEALQAGAPGFFEAGSDPAVVEVVLTPDFHKGAGIPIGTVLATRGFAVPQAVGNDVNCGMRLAVTSLERDQVAGRLDELERVLRHTFFEGGRQIPLTPVQREALVRHGLPGLLETHAQAGGQGLWRYVDAAAETKDLARMHGGGGYPTEGIRGLADYVESAGKLSYDSQIGSVGGGNHFAEIQWVRKILDGAAAHAWGLTEGQVVAMIHSGSLGLGHRTGSFALEVMKEIWPAGVARPANEIYLLPRGERFLERYGQFRTSLSNSANFAFGNRFFLSLMIRAALEQAVGPTAMRVLYDAPHNLMWEEELDGRPVCLHRKGATPARGWQAMAGTPFEYFGEPVIVPGSMGAPSYLLVGSGSRDSLCTACHGAGRALSRGEALAAPDEEFEEFLRRFRVVTAVDPRRPDVRGRRDILDKWRESLKKEAPFAYKDITPVIETLKAAGVGRPVAELYPLITVKS